MTLAGNYKVLYLKERSPTIAVGDFFVAKGVPRVKEVIKRHCKKSMSFSIEEKLMQPMNSHPVLERKVFLGIFLLLSFSRKAVGMKEFWLQFAKNINRKRASLGEYFQFKTYPKPTKLRFYLLVFALHIR